MKRRSFDQREHIAQAFDRGATTYDQDARVQREAGGLLEARIANFVGDTPITRIVDLGCGTGVFTRALALRYPRAAFVACDIAQAMVEKTKETLSSVSDQGRFAFICADAENITFTPQPDLITSNFAMQWFADPLTAIAHHARRTRFLAWTTLIEGTFATWIAAHELRGVSDGMQRFIDAPSIVAACEHLRPARMLCTIDAVEERFPNAVEFLRSLRSIGAGTARENHKPTPLQGILRDFKAGFTAEYRICTMLLEMPRHASPV